MIYVIRFQRPCREAGTLIAEHDSTTLEEASDQLAYAYSQATRNCRYWIEAVEDNYRQISA
jgi:hypothetical protein